MRTTFLLFGVLALTSGSPAPRSVDSIIPTPIKLVQSDDSSAATAGQEDLAVLVECKKNPESEKCWIEIFEPPEDDDHSESKEERGMFGVLKKRKHNKGNKRQRMHGLARDTDSVSNIFNGFNSFSTGDS